MFFKDKFKICRRCFNYLKQNDVIIIWKKHKNCASCNATPATLRSVGDTFYLHCDNKYYQIFRKIKNDEILKYLVKMK